MEVVEGFWSVLSVQATAKSNHFVNDILQKSTFWTIRFLTSPKPVLGCFWPALDPQMKPLGHVWEGSTNHGFRHPDALESPQVPVGLRHPSLKRSHAYFLWTFNIFRSSRCPSSYPFSTVSVEKHYAITLSMSAKGFPFRSHDIPVIKLVIQQSTRSNSRSSIRSPARSIARLSSRSIARSLHLSVERFVARSFLVWNFLRISTGSIDCRGQRWAS